MKTHDTLQSIERDALMELLSTPDLESVLNQAADFHTTQGFLMVLDPVMASPFVSLVCGDVGLQPLPSQVSTFVLLHFLASGIQAPGDWPVLARSALSDVNQGDRRFASIICYPF
ncbi:hypothetical protein KBY83_08035 [Cyanobium sp. WKJ7-Wakatipu]|uniref:hypothetical protein n=1 Tax=Cyanobium sp. WKJ7-Wakatipu TaxID=2823726 RepID=UPI0020CE9A77|nr:hypothetical protein [Cyanobium sp. WKJ7-Wakatipu]MCP9783269.1 hypothetical protein [Cyanobium sp. WKJ7-Wakatipu]